MATIKNLAFKGGGVLGIAYAGVIKVLEDQNVLQSVEKVAGTSAGAITAALLSLNYNATEIYNIVNSTNFADFEDDKDFLRVVTKYGLYKGDALLAWVEQQVVNKGLPASATFTDFKNHGCRDLTVFSTDINIKGLKVFSFETSPNVVVAEAVRASMSIPLFFDAYTFRNNIPDDHMYVDGGMIYNFPITYFDVDGVPNEETMGLYLENLGPATPPVSIGPDHFISYVKAVFETLMDAQVVNFEEDVEENKRTVVIDNLGLSATDFNLTKAQQLDLYSSGIKYTTQYLKNKVSELVS